MFTPAAMLLNVVYISVWATFNPRGSECVKHLFQLKME